MAAHGAGVVVGSSVPLLRVSLGAPAPLQWWADLRMGVGGGGEARLRLSWSCLHTQSSRRVIKSCPLLE